jgi:hypothetical protein
MQRLRRAGKRLSGPLAKRRSGYFFVWSRALLARLDKFAKRGPDPVALESVALEALPARVVGAGYRELEPPVGDVTPPPQWVWPPGFPSSRRTMRARARGQGVVEIPGGVVFGWRGDFGPDPDAVLADASPLWDGDEATAVRESAKALTRGLVELDGITMSVWAGSGGDNHAHSLLQSVPRLDLLRRAYGLEADRFLLTPQQPALIEALAILGVPTDRLMFVPWPSPAYRCTLLRAATSPGSQEYGIDWVVDFLHELFLPQRPTPKSRRIYLRRGVPTRKVLNEDDVLDLLEPAGFEAVSMSGRSIQEQAALFASAEVVVATHGAALANLVFAAPRTVVVELMGKNTASPNFAKLAWRRGLDYRLIMGTEPSPPDRWWTWQRFADTIVDVCELRTCLEQLGLR